MKKLFAVVISAFVLSSIASANEAMNTSADMNEGGSAIAIQKAKKHGKKHGKKAGKHGKKHGKKHQEEAAAPAADAGAAAAPAADAGAAPAAH